MNLPGDRFLTDREKEQLTGYKRGGWQKKQLQKMGVRHFMRADGKPEVLLSAISGEGSSPSGVQPNFDALND